MDLALLAVGGVLLGGTWSLWRQGAPFWLLALLLAAAALSLVASAVSG